MVDRLRVLIVDDDQDFLDVMSEFLRRCGCIAVACNCLPDCLAAIHRDAFDVAIIDGFLRGCDGCDAVQELRSADPGVRIVLLSGCDDLARREQAIRAGADIYLLKPCSIAVIRNVVQPGVGGTQQHRAIATPIGALTEV